MRPESVFSSLAASLPDRERKELLARITRSLSLRDRTEENIHPSTVAEDERYELMLQEMERLSLWQRMLLRIRRLLSGKAETDLFLVMKRSELLHRIRRKNASVTIPDGRMFTGELARRFYDLYLASRPLVPFFRRLWHDTPFLEEMISYLLEQRIPEAKRNAVDMLPMEEMRRIYSARERPEDLRRELLSRLNRYIESIPEELFHEMEEGIVPLYALKGIVLFPYREFFQIFDYRLPERPAESNPQFRNASAVPVLPFLDMLYYAFYTVEKRKESFRIHPELLHFFATDGSPDRDVSEEAKNREERLSREIKDALATIRHEIAKFRKEVPLMELIRFHREDPYYRLMFYLPRLDLKDFYASTLRIRFLAELESAFREVRRGLIDEMTARFFLDRTPEELAFYREYPGFDPKSLRLPYFSYLKSMPILYTFLTRRYESSIRESVEILNGILTGRRRELQSRVILHSAGLEDLAERIRQFDHSFSPEAEDGKTFYRIRYTLDNDLSQQRTYRTLIAQKDREAWEILDRGREHIVGLQTAFRESMALLQPDRDARGDEPAEPHPFVGTLQSHMEEMDRFLKLLREVMEIETGR